MEIATVARRPSGLPVRWRVFAVAAALLPVTLFAVVPMALGLERYVVSGTSMSGSIERGSVVLERRVPVGELRDGDIITFDPPSDYSASGLVTHRIVSVDTDGIVTKGDANELLDPWVLPSAAQSRVVLTVPYVGLPFTGDLDRGLWLVVVVVGLGLIAAIGVLRDARDTMRHRSSLASVARDGPR